MATTPSFQTLDVSLHFDHVFLIAFNRPKVYNALSPQAYDDWLAALQYAAKAPHIRVVVMTGTGPFYSSGQELSPPSKEMLQRIGGGNLRTYFEKRVGVTKALVELLIDYPKLVVVGVNGPAVGIAVTTMVLADLVYAVPHATFRTPFMDLALCVEACSSVTFPRALGPAKAKDMLLMGRIMTAQEWEKAGLITDIIPVEGFREAVLQKARHAARYSPTAVQESLKLIRQVDRDLLRQMNDLELKLLVDRLVSDEFNQAVQSFMARSKSKQDAKKAASGGKPSKL